MAKPNILSRAQREEAGRKRRDRCQRASHGEVILGQGGKRDVVTMVTSSNKSRLQNLVPIRHGRMLQSAFAFFRGTANIQAHDLAGTPSSGIIVQACGDCHLMNFGGFATPERNLIFDINDFDETDRAPFERDLKRLAASFVVAAQFDQAIGDYATCYADQVELDYAAFAKAARDGRLKTDLSKSELAELLR